MAGMSRSAIGKASNRKGKEGEQAVARYLRECGWPQAKRTVRTGWNTGSTRSRDVGDIDGTPGLVWQVKTGAADISGATIVAILAETEDQAVAGGADYGFAVLRRPGKADPAHWWCWMTASDLRRLALGYESTVAEHRVRRDHWTVPVRLQLGHVIPMLRENGYGSSAEVDSA